MKPAALAASEAADHHPLPDAALPPEDPFPGIPVCKNSSAFRARRSRIIAHNIKKQVPSLLLNS